MTRRLAIAIVSGCACAAALYRWPAVADTAPLTIECPRVTTSYQARVTRVVDGDTLDVTVELGFGVSVDIRLRLLGVDTPEMHSFKHESQEYTNGLAAKAFATNWLDGHGHAVIIDTQAGRGKYGRHLATVHPPDGSQSSLNAALLESGHAREVTYR